MKISLVVPVIATAMLVTAALAHRTRVKTPAIATKIEMKKTTNPVGAKQARPAVPVSNFISVPISAPVAGCEFVACGCDSYVYTAFTSAAMGHGCACAIATVVVVEEEEDEEEEEVKRMEETNPVGAEQERPAVITHDVCEDSKCDGMTCGTLNAVCDTGHIAGSVDGSVVEACAHFDITKFAVKPGRIQVFDTKIHASLENALVLLKRPATLWMKECVNLPFEVQRLFW